MPHPDIFRVTHDIPFPGLRHVHTYLADGPSGGLVCIDTSLGWQDSLHRIVSSIERLGRRITDLEQIILTHCHPDHIGLTAQLQQMSGAKVLCHPLVEWGYQKLQTPDFWDSVAAHYVEHGWEAGRGAWPFVAFEMPLEFQFINHGDTLEFGHGTWEVHHTPGHERGHLAFFRQSDSTLIAGDTLLGSITPHVGYTLDPPDPLGQFLDSLKRMAELSPRLVLAGHGRAFGDGAQRAHAIRWHHTQRLQRLREVLATGPQSAADISLKLFGERHSDMVQRLAMSETLAHLEYLRLSGQAGRECPAGVWLYSAR